MSQTPVNPNTVARDYCAQFLYQCETEKIFYFSAAMLDEFINNFSVPQNVQAYLRKLAKGTLDQLDRIDGLLTESSRNWNLARMANTDRSVLRLSCYELLESDTPTKVILNEAIELSKKYGSEKSGGFVNGILDNLAKALRP